MRCSHQRVTEEAAHSSPRRGERAPGANDPRQAQTQEDFGTVAVHSCQA